MSLISAGSISLDSTFTCLLPFTYIVDLFTVKQPIWGTYLHEKKHWIFLGLHFSFHVCPSSFFHFYMIKNANKITTDCFALQDYLIKDQIPLSLCPLDFISPKWPMTNDHAVSPWEPDPFQNCDVFVFYNARSLYFKRAQAVIWTQNVLVPVFLIYFGLYGLLEFGWDILIIQTVLKVN